MAEPNVFIANAAEHTLSVPDGIPLKAIIVEVEVEPLNASVLIYGGPTYTEPQKVTGRSGRIDLPFDNPRIYVQKLHDATGYKIWTHGWREAR